MLGHAIAKGETLAVSGEITTLQHLTHSRHSSKTKSADAQTDIAPFQDTQTRLFTPSIALIKHSNSL